MSRRQRRANGRDHEPVPPHSIEAEQAALGCLLIDAHAWSRVAELLGPDDFYRADHRLIFQAMQELAADDVHGDVITTSELLKDAGTLEAAGGLAYLGTLARDTPTAANAEVYAKRVRDLSLLRELVQFAASINRAIVDGRAVDEVLISASQSLAKLQIIREASAPRLRLQTLDEYVVRPVVTYLVRDLVPADAIVVFFGAAKSGKTHTVTDLAMHAAHGMHWHGHTVSHALRVAYLVGEGCTGLRVRLRAWQTHHAAELRGDYRILAETLPLAERLADVLAALRDYAPDIVVLDTLNAYFGRADENSTQDMTAFAAAVRRLRDDLRCAVIAIHHSGLSDAGRERGSSVLRAASDVIVQVARDDGGSGLIGVQVIEARDVEPWRAPLSLRLTSVATDWADDDGQPIATCVIEAGDAPVTLPGRGGRPLGDAQAALLAAAQELARAVEPDARGEVLLARHLVSALAQERGLDRRRVSDSWTSLARRGLVRLVEPGSVAMRSGR